MLEKLNEIDALIEPHLKDWDFKRLGSMEKGDFTLRAYEIGFTPTQNPIIINECIELGKLYAEPNTPKFLNAILDSLSKKLAQKPLNWGCFIFNDCEKLKREHDLGNNQRIEALKHEIYRA